MSQPIIIVVCITEGNHKRYFAVPEKELNEALDVLDDMDIGYSYFAVYTYKTAKEALSKEEQCIKKKALNKLSKLERKLLNLEDDPK